LGGADDPRISCLIAGGCVRSERAAFDRPVCVAALLAHKCEVDARTDGASHFTHTHTDAPFAYQQWTPLMMAARYGRLESMKVSGAAFSISQKRSHRRC
jgi:hypothetical protein